MKPVATICFALALCGAPLPGQIASTLLVDSASVNYTYPPIIAQTRTTGRLAVSAQISSGRFVPKSLKITVASSASEQFVAPLERSMVTWRFTGPKDDSTASGTWSAEIEFRRPEEEAHLEDRSAILLRQRSDQAGNEHLVIGPDPTLAKLPIAEPRAHQYRQRAFDWAITQIMPPAQRPAAIVCVGYLLGKGRVSVSDADLAALARPRVAATALERCPPTFTTMVSTGRHVPGDDPHTILVEELVLLHRARRDWIAITFAINHATSRTRYHCRLPADDDSAELRCEITEVSLS